MPDRARWHDDLPDACRVSLPHGRGSLYHYSRETAGATQFGFFLIDRKRGVSVLVELPETDEENPWLTNIAPGPDGLGLLLATRMPAGGNLYEVDLAGGTVFDRTQTMGPVAFSANALWLNRTFGFGVGADGIYRFKRETQTQAEAVTFPPGSAPTWFSGEAVVNGDRTIGATTAGSGPASLRMYVFGEVGPALPASGAPAALAGAGFLPESEGGPWMAVSADGSVCAWSVGQSTREAFLAPVTGTDPFVQVTAPTFFDDTLDSVGGLTFFTGNQLLMTIGVGGDENEAVTESANVFTVQYVDAVPELTSLTAGHVTPPFGSYAGAEPERYFRVPQADGLLMFDEEEGELLAILGGSHPYGQVKISDVEDVDFIEAVGDDLIVSVELNSAPGIHQLYILPAHLGTNAELVVQGALGDRFRHPAPGDGTIGFIIESADGSDQMARLALATGVMETFPGRTQDISSIIAHSHSGAQVFATGGAQNTFVVWPQNGPPRRLPMVTGEGFALPTY